MSNFFVEQAQPFFLLDGGMGTMLQANGLKPGQLPELLNLSDPQLIERIHRAYLEAGSRAVYANTFSCNARKLAGSGHRVEEVVLAAIRNARKAAADSCALVALDIGPCGELLAPLGTLSFDAAYQLFAQVAEAGEKAGADFAVIETMTDLQEARAALLAVKEHTALPVLVTMSYDETGRSFTGCTPAAMARTLQGLGADALGVNCSLGPKELVPLVRELAQNCHLPIAAKPNAGLPDPVDGHYSLSAEAFAQDMRALAEAGAVLLGGCCGTTPQYIAALSQALAGVSPGPQQYQAVSTVCSASRCLTIDQARVTGERINPTGKKKLQQALLSGDVDYTASLALSQMEAGAELLDVNVGHPGVDEAAMLPAVVQAVQAVCPLPLQLDSTDPAALEAALRVYCGKAAVNSVNGSAASLAVVLPLVKKYGAAVVGLTLDDSGLPATAAERVAIARRILDAATALGIPKEDVWIDCLTLTVSAEQQQAEETLAAVRTVHQELGLQVTLGVSNISFGLPGRPQMTAAFLLRALDAGLTLPIMNPSATEVMDALVAYRALHGTDPGCHAYVARFAQRQSAPQAAAPTAQAQPAQAAKTVADAVRLGLRADAARLAEEDLKTQAPLEVVEQSLIPALDAVGVAYEQGKAFLPQLLAAAQAAQSVFTLVRQRMEERGSSVSRGRLILATVHGDIHDIGKNIVRTLLENYGWEIIDLGRDVPARTIADTAAETGVRLVGLSALMTTTLPAMEETVRLLKALPDPPEVMVGGAVVTEQYAQHIGAHYARDARAAAALVERLLGG